APGGFGAPGRQPQGEPGYGYPGPQQPAGQQPGYGYPGQQPGYGYPGQQQYGEQPYGQQQYAMHPPGVPAPGGQGTPPGGSNPAKQRMMIIIGAAVAVLLIVGSGVWFSSTRGDDGKKDAAQNSSDGAKDGEKGGGDSKKPVDVDADLLYSVEKPKVKDVTGVYGLWVTEKVFAKGAVDSVIGYDKANGKEKWNLPLDGQICWASKQVTDDGRTAVVTQESKIGADGGYKDCSQVALIDLNTGKKLWQKSVTVADEELRFEEVTIGDGVVAAGGLSGGAAWSLESGKELWKPDQTSDCEDAGYGGGDALVAVRKCGSYDSPKIEIQKLDPSTGKPEFTYEVPSGVGNTQVVSTDPLVVGIDAGNTVGAGVSDFIALDDKGKMRSRIPTENGKYIAECSSEVESCEMVVVGKDALYLGSKEHEAQGEDYGHTNEIVAFDLGTGKPKGQAEAGGRRIMSPVQMDGKDLIAYQESTFDQGGQVISIDPKTFKSTVHIKHPVKTVDIESNFRPTLSTWLVYDNGRLYLGKEMISERSASTEGPEFLMVVFGSA
ncbi:MAG TPA: hypothetical protein DEQ61_20405, partial [Streptomyces sp.]|nr:hypothetical protein [Streptomyces sp.]